MTRKNKTVMATVAKSEELQAMLKDPKFPEAWQGYIDELEKDAALVVRGVQPTGIVLGKAAQRVIEIAADLPTYR